VIEDMLLFSPSLPPRLAFARNWVNASTDMPCMTAELPGKLTDTELAVVDELRDGSEAELPMDDPERDVATDPAGRLDA
jgi:hypothetical protein